MDGVDYTALGMFIVAGGVVLVGVWYAVSGAIPILDPYWWRGGGWGRLKKRLRKE